jgi:hypothetical protein
MAAFHHWSCLKKFQIRALGKAHYRPRQLA